MSGRPDVIFVGMVCSVSGDPGVARVVRSGAGWNLVGVSRQRPGSVLPTADTPEATGVFYADPAYSGCFHCGARGFVRCGRCQTLGCWQEESDTFRCGHCGSSGPVTGTIESLSVLGGG
jgi:hypothetical protein